MKYIHISKPVSEPMDSKQLKITMLKESIQLNMAWVSASTCDFSYAQDYLHAQAFCTTVLSLVRELPSRKF